ncbi:rhodanese-like domain-containing protein [Streptomyces sp. NPDC055239]
MENHYFVIIPIEIDEDNDDVFRSIIPGSRFRLVNVAEWESFTHWEEAMNVCPMLGQQLAVVHASGYEAIRTVLPAAGPGQGGGHGDEVAELSPTETRRRLADGELALVDVRQDEEWAAVRPAGAVHAALDTAPASLSELPDGPVAFICRTGRRSTRAAAQAVSAGRSAVFSVTGGLEAWEAAGLPVLSGPTGK